MNWRNEMNKNSMGGTELLMERLVSSLGEEFLEGVQIIPTRVRELDNDKIRILWIHDTESDPECSHLANGGWKKFHKIVFVSYTQQQDFIRKFNIPYSQCTVLSNSIVPIDVDLDKKTFDRIELVYTPTPHRGLGILVPVFERLHDKYKDKIHLSVYSSFKLYGWDERDKEFEELYQRIRDHDGMSYFGTVPNDEIRESLKTKHIFAYPSTWRETGCLCLMEAMSAGLACVHSSLGALPETAANWTFMYDYIESPDEHARRLLITLDHAIQMFMKAPPIGELKTQKSYADIFYSNEMRMMQWNELILGMKAQYQDQPLSPPEQKYTFKYGA